MSRPCLICEGPLPAPHVKFYCSGKCIEDAKAQGISGNETASDAAPPPKDTSKLHPAFVRATENLRRKGIIK